MHLIGCLVVAGCDLEPEPAVTSINAKSGQGLTLRGESVAADEVEWLFAEKPVAATGSFVWEDLEEANFVPTPPGDYTVDRWTQSGAVKVWTDRFIVNVEGVAHRLRVTGPYDLNLGVATEYEVRLSDTTVELAELAFVWTLRSVEERRALFVQASESGDRATITVDKTGSYVLSVKGIFDQGETAQNTRFIEVR